MCFCRGFRCSVRGEISFEQWLQQRMGCGGGGGSDDDDDSDNDDDDSDYGDSLVVLRE